jgi:polyphosphate glucokinase
MKATTLSVDCGGTGIKASVLSETGKVSIEYPYLKTPYPLSPNRLISIIEEFVKTGPKINRVTVGLPRNDSRWQGSSNSTLH